MQKSKKYYKKLVSMIIVLCVLMISPKVLQAGKKDVIKKHYDDVVKTLLLEKDYEACLEKLDKGVKKVYGGSRDTVLYLLDKGFVLHLGGKYNESVQNLSLAEQKIEEKFTKRISQEAQSYLINDFSLDYPGEDYEDVFVNVLNALNYMKLNNLDAFGVEVRKVNAKLNGIKAKYELKDVPSSVTSFPLANFLSMIMYFSDGKIDEASIDRENVLGVLANKGREYKFLSGILDSPEGGKVPLWIVSMGGWGPAKAADVYVTFLGSDGSLNIYKLIYESEDDASRLLATISGPNAIMSSSDFQMILSIPAFENILNSAVDVLGQTNSKVAENANKIKEFILGMIREPLYFSIPKVVDRNNGLITKVEVSVDGGQPIQLGLIEDFSEKAIEVFNLKKRWAVSKAVLRVILQRGVTQYFKQLAAQKAGPLGGKVAGTAAVSLANILAEADVRCFRFMPALAFGGRVDVTPGRHRVVMRYISQDGNEVGREEMNVVANEKGLNLLSSIYLPPTLQ